MKHSFRNAAREEEDYHQFFSGDRKGYRMAASRKKPSEDWYISAMWKDGGYIVDGYWSDSADKTLEDAIAELVRLTDN